MVNHRCIILLIVFLLQFNSGKAQEDKRSNVWYFGYNAGIDFNGGKPKPLADSKMSQWEGSASICDQQGRLLLYTNGIQIWNNKHRVIAGANNIGGNESSTQSAIIVPKPGSANIYYVFTTFTQLTCVVVDISLNHGEGGIVSNDLIMTNGTEKLAAVQHCNRKDYWIVTHEAGNNVFRTYLLTEKGLDKKYVKTSIGTSYQLWGTIGYLKVSSQQNKLVAAISDQNTFDLFNFDHSTGTISNAVSLVDKSFYKAYGVEFSPGGNFLYVSERLTNLSPIYQLDIRTGNSASILNSKVAIGRASRSFFGALTLGPDKRIYVARDKEKYLSVIDKPDLKGVKCTYIENGINLGSGTSGIGLPNFIPAADLTKPALLVEEQKDCNTTVLTARFSQPDEAVAYQWYRNNVIIQGAGQATYRPLSSGSYTVTVSYSCSTEKMTSDTKEVELLTAAPAAVKLNCGFYQLAANTDAAFEWSGETITAAQQGLDSIVVSGSGIKSFTLRIYDADDSTCFIEKNLTVDFGYCDARVFAPDIFTPNQDGVNDTFKVVTAGGTTLGLAIYNRWGAQVFSSSDPDVAWDGKVNMADCPTGYYVYRYRYKTEQGEEYEKKGSFLLQR